MSPFPKAYHPADSNDLLPLSAGAFTSGLYLGPRILFMLTMRRQKRTRRVVAYIPDHLFEQLELFRGEESNVLSMSDYLHDVIEQHLNRSMRVSKQTIGRRVVNS